MCSETSIRPKRVRPVEPFSLPSHIRASLLSSLHALLFPLSPRLSSAVTHLPQLFDDTLLRFIGCQTITVGVLDDRQQDLKALLPLRVFFESLPEAYLSLVEILIRL